MFGTFGLQNVPEFSLRFKMHGCRVYAKPLSGRSRTVCKQMAEVLVAFGTDNFSSGHSMAEIGN